MHRIIPLLRKTWKSEKYDRRTDVTILTAIIIWDDPFISTRAPFDSFEREK